MSCQACVQIPLDAHAKFMNKIRKYKSIHKSRVRVVYVSPKSDIKLLINGSLPPVTTPSYFTIDSGPTRVYLKNRKREILTDEEFIFEKDSSYTLIVHKKEIYQLSDYLICPEIGTARLQIYNMNDKTINLYLDEELIYEELEPQNDFEVAVDAGIYELRVEPELSPMIEIELKSPNIYTVFFTPTTSFVVENPYCTNLI